MSQTTASVLPKSNMPYCVVLNPQYPCNRRDQSSSSRAKTGDIQSLSTINPSRRPRQRTRPRLSFNRTCYANC
jgi:hypothetical protein